MTISNGCNFPLFRILESDDAVFEFEKFYFEISSPLLRDVIVETNIDSCIVTNAVSGHFVAGADNIVIGRRSDQIIRMKISGTTNQKTEYLVTVPAKVPDSSSQVDLVEPDSYLERLWAFMTVKKAIRKSQPENMIKLVRTKRDKQSKNKLQAKDNSSNINSNGNNINSNQECIRSVFTSKYGFVTNLTSLLVTEKDLEDPNYKLAFPPEMMKLPILSTFVPKSLNIETSCKGSLVLYSQTYLRGLDFEVKADVLNVNLEMDGFAKKATSFKITGDVFVCECEQII